MDYVDNVGSPWLIFDPGTSCLRVGLPGRLDPIVSTKTFIWRPKASEKWVRASLQGPMRPGDPNSAGSYIPLDDILHDTLSTLGIGEVGLPQKQQKLWDVAIQNANEAMGTTPERLCILQPMAPGVGFEVHEESMVVDWAFTHQNFKEVTFVPDYVVCTIGSGQTTGILVDVGAVWTRIIPIFDGKAESQACVSIPIGGAEVTSFLLKYVANSAPDVDLCTNSLREAKEKHCFVSMDRDRDLRVARAFRGVAQIQLDLDRGKKYVDLAEAVFMAPETLLCPFLNIYNVDVVHAVLNSVSLCAMDIRRAMLQNICVVGGSSAIPNFPQRLETDLCNLWRSEFLSSTNISVRGGSAGGASMFRTLAGNYDAIVQTLQNCTVTREQYAECGTQSIQRLSSMS